MSSEEKIPSWVVSSDDKKLYGKALGLGAPQPVLADKDICLGFVESKDPPQASVPAPKRHKIEQWNSLFDLADPSAPNILEGKSNAVVNIGMVEPLGQVVPQHRIFVRQSYLDLFPKIWEQFKETKRVAISLTGTPGIGKSLFGFLYLIELVRFFQKSSASQTNPTTFGLGLNGVVVYEHVQEVNSPATYYLVYSETKEIFITEEKPLALLSQPNTFLIKDGPCTTYDVGCSVLWVSSPRSGSFQKAVELGQKMYVLPPWTTDELVDCWKAQCAPMLFPLSTEDDAKAVRDAETEVKQALDDDVVDEDRNEAVLRRWIADLGPVARRVFNPAKAYSKMKDAFSDLSQDDLNQLKQYATSKDAPGETKFKQSHRLLLMVPSSDFTTFELIPSSVKLGQTFLRKSLESDIKSVESLLGKMQGAHLGLAFEPYAHFMLSRENSFQIRNLETGVESELKVEDRSTVEVSNCALPDLVLKPAEYYVPTDPCFPAIDSWDTANMFQMTVAMTHPIKSGAKNFKALKGKGPTRIIFVVPKGLASDFQRQPLVLANGKPAPSAGGPTGGWNDVEQFVLGL
mmetsp:Transcript_873/g.1708  ORF Transcript_873/g.1708 Transcript_873/m.1708 type:complete len:572 (+) Transcript_873:28-1743(+)|eukprot:CAMPEP_0175167656 /NCGR_PEP_ID=MMETSP0087-20121206/28471_1 /TAXON_ID=136419 /ORGANISM="Unknown Unknown, Strain D1" /LENGTH=571 /DNA_ID=CAMNT_0016457585 /DNA_START=28 /DNA_END=1743 /DNA_ORIENTATION=+